MYPFSSRLCCKAYLIFQQDMIRGAGRPSGQHTGLVILWSWVRSRAPARNNGQSFFHPMPLIPSSKIGTCVLVSCHGLLPGGWRPGRGPGRGNTKALKSSQDYLKMIIISCTYFFKGRAWTGRMVKNVWFICIQNLYLFVILLLVGQ